MKQQTIKNEITVSGTGLHSGRKVSIKFKPAKPGSGIVFVRTDLSKRSGIKAVLPNVSSTVRGTNLDGIYTVEHVLSALHALLITNVMIELDGPEPPALDGSSLGYCRLIKKAGIAVQRRGSKCIKIQEPVFLMDNEKCIIALPSDRLTISFVINYPLDFIGLQFYKVEINPRNYIKEIAPARTYGFMREVSALRKQGLALGANYRNAIVIGKSRYLTKLRYRDELVRHKILDLMGDLALLGSEIKAHIICVKSGHDLNIRFAKKLLRLTRNK